MYIISGTLYIIVGLLTLLAYFLWAYFLWYFYHPLLIFSIVFIALGIGCYFIEYKRKTDSK